VIVVGSRVDAFTIAFRVFLDPAFVTRLRERAEVAKKYGRAAVEWEMRAPDAPGSRVVDARTRFGELPLRWADDWAGPERVVTRCLGELRFSRAANAWQITNEPFFRAQVLLKGPGAGEGAPERCAACDGIGAIRGAACGACDGVGSVEDPGWNVEVVWYAQEIARIGLRAVLAESKALAAAWGDVKEARVRRIDLCADVAGWEVKSEDLKRIVKRPRAGWNVHDDGIEDQEQIFFDRPADVAGGGQLASRHVTGISIGRGGAIMARLYDKRRELTRSSSDSSAEKREAEETRWRAAGWDGLAPVTRVEFQIRGMAVAEFGLRDPDGATEPVYVLEKDRRGKLRSRPAGVRTCVTADGEVLGLCERIDFLWSSCLDWCRLVVPEETRTGTPKAASRLPEDARWTLLRQVRFDEEARAAEPIRRFRKRSAASSAQSLGVGLSQAAREGLLSELGEDVVAVDAPDALSMLRAMLVALKLAEVERIERWLLEREGSPQGALACFAVRSNAARARFLRYARAAAPREGPRKVQGSSRLAA
jgi:hypothetical protein